MGVFLERLYPYECVLRGLTPIDMGSQELLEEMCPYLHHPLRGGVQAQG